MSLKDLFDKVTVTKSLARKSAKEIGDEVESVNYHEADIIEENRFIPDVDFSRPENFARYGSAKKYYTDAITNIYKTYPYDGSLYERLDWQNSSSYVDLHVLENEYPRTNGYINFSYGGWGDIQGDVSASGYGYPKDKEYISLYGGPHLKNTVPRSAPANLWDPDNNRESNLEFNLAEGTSVEFWLKKRAFVTGSTEKEVIFDLWNYANSSSVDYGRFRIELTGAGVAQAGADPFRVTLMSGTTGVVTASVCASTFTTASVADDAWHHYAFTFDATTKVRKIYRDGVEMASDISSSNYLSNYLYIGRGYLYGSQQWDGLIDEVKVWNKALSTSEVNASMKLSDDYSESGLIHAYDFNEGTGTTAYDRIGSENFKFVNMDATNWKNINGGTILSSSNQTITFPSIEAKDVNDPDFELEAYSDSFLPISYTSSDENVATISGNIVTIVGVGSTEITASQSGNSCYDSTGVVRVLEVGNQQAQVITFELQNTASVVDETITLNAISSSGLPVTYTSSNNSVASVLGNILRIRGAGEVAITASQGGSADYEAAPPVIRTLTVTKGSQTITFGALADVAYGDAPFKLLATTNSGLTVIYKSSNESVATIDGNLVSIVGVGTTSITASQLGDENYEAATDVTQDLVINKGAQTISFDALIAKNYGDASFDLSATASSGLGVVYSSSNTSVATISGSTVSIVGIGTTTITASQAGNDNYAAASDVTQDLIINKASQTISFDALIPKSYGDASFDLSATASSGLGVVYSSSNTSVATISGSTVSIVGIGTTTITASQSGNDNYAAASDVTQDLIINKTPQTISFGTLSSKTYGDTSFDLTATASSGLAVSYTSSNTSVATVSGSTVTIVGGGTTTITASQLGDATYAAAPDVAQELVVAQVSQTISFGTLSSKTYGDTSFDLTATASSGLAVSYTSSNTSVATVSGSTITIVGAGTTTITASQSGNSSYTAANSVDQVFTVNKGSQTITFDALASKQVSDTPFDLTATATSGLTVSYVSSNTAVATISGSRVTIVGAGTSTITASQSGNANYSEASPVDQVLTVTKLSQSITFDTLGDQNLIDGTAALSATGGDSGNSITFSSSDDAVASVSGSTLTLNGVGTVTIYANQAGNATYEAASEVSQTFDVFELYIWDGSSWNSGTTPPSNKDLEIASNYSLSSDLEVNNLFINSSSIVEVTDGATLTINSGLTNEGAFYVRSGSSLITYSTTSISGNVTIERTTSYADGRYSFVGSPVQSNEAIIGSDLGGHVYQYDESASSDENSLSRWVDASANVLTPGKGYTQADKQGISFTGIPNDGTITYSGSYVNDGWHLVSNPYPAAIYIDDFLDANTNTTDAVYIWDDNGSNHGRGSNSDYIVANKVGATDVGGIDNSDKWNGFIGSMQGFFVKLDGAAGTIAFTESMRATGNNTDGSYFRTNSEKIPVLRINLTHSDGLKRQTLIGWRSGASNTELEEGYDAKVFSTSGEYQVYTTKSETPLAIQTINYENESIPLTVKVAEAGLYELSIDQLDAQGHILYLLDKSIEEVIDLNEGSYQFQANAGISDRFELIKSMSILGANQLEFVLYAYEKSVYVRQPEGNRTRLKLMSISGQQIWSSDVTSSQKIDFSHLSEGVYILSDGNQSTKIILR
ncbi:MAG TPA: hypothetical protein DHN29_22255 [Cytophagales bacterium]|nr:hypothetical protein [Cytophagales bacterium]